MGLQAIEKGVGLLCDGCKRSGFYPPWAYMAMRSPSVGDAFVYEYVCGDCVFVDEAVFNRGDPPRIVIVLDRDHYDQGKQIAALLRDDSVPHGLYRCDACCQYVRSLTSACLDCGGAMVELKG